MDGQDRKLVQRLLDVEEGLTRWEVEFAEGLARAAAEGRRLNGVQRAKVEQILDRIDSQR